MELKPSRTGGKSMLHYHFRDLWEVFFIRPIILRSGVDKFELPTETIKKRTFVKKQGTVAKKERERRYGV